MDNTKPNLKKAKILASISVILHQWALASTFPLAIYSVYILSYLINTKNIPDESYFTFSFFPIPILTFILTLGVPLGEQIERLIGNVLAISISAIGIIAALFLFVISKSIPLLFVSYLLLGISSGSSSVISTKYAASFYQGNKGFMTALVGSSSNIFIGGFNLIGDFLILNPKKVNGKEGSGVYIDLTTQTYTTYIGIAGLLNVVFTVVVVVLLMINKKINPKENDINKQLPKQDTQLFLPESDQVDSLIDTSTVKQIITNQNITKIMTPQQRELYYKNRRTLLTSCHVYRLSLQIVLAAFLPLLVASVYRPISLQYGRDNTMLVIAATATSVCSAVMSPLWGIIFDKLGFKTLMLISSIGGICVGCVIMLFAFSSDLLILIVVIVNQIVIGAVTSVFPHTAEIYGITFAGMIGSLLSVGIGLIGVVGAVLAYVVRMFVDNTDVGNYIIFGCGVAMSVIAVVMTVFDKEEKFDYGEDGMYEEDANEEEEEENEDEEKNEE